MNTDASHDLNLQTKATDHDLVSCPQCKKIFQILNPQEGLIYSCFACEAQFIVFKKSDHLEAAFWSEDEVLKKILEVPASAGPSQISRLWKCAFHELDNPKAHKDFVSLCIKMNHLDYAKDKYKLLKYYLNWDQLPIEVQNMMYPPPKEQSPLLSKLHWGLLAVSGLFILLGLVHPGLKNMFGAGFMMGILTILFYRQKFKSSLLKLGL